MRLIVAGSGEFALPTLRGLLEAGHDVAQVFTQPDRPAGRGRALTSTPVGRFCEASALPLARTPDLNQEALPACDAMVVIAFGQKLSPDVVNHPRLGSINLHASRLPKYRGAAPINWALIRGERETGNSVIRLADRMDAGHLLGQSEVPIDPLETAGELHDRLAIDGVRLVLRVLDALQAGRAVEEPQDEALATIAPKLTRESSRLDWHKPATELANQIRGMHPWPGCRVTLTGAGSSLRLTLVRARPVEGAAGPSPGVLTDTGTVGTGQGTIEIVELQPEGKRPMTLASFRNGHPWQAGMRLEPLI